MRATEHAVVIAVGGPAGMMLAAELALAKVDVAVVARRPDHVLVCFDATVHAGQITCTVRAGAGQGRRFHVSTAGSEVIGGAP
jgi:2-polyprenyl-6-methoxyphenol hydroxylase-like FAD-dependent oxidoreductase